MPRDPISGEAPTDQIRIVVDQCANQETKLGGIDLYYPNADGRFQVGKGDPKLHQSSPEKI
jgi:hypothetical protein